MYRLFVAIRPPADQRARLLSLMGEIDGARWQNEDQMHLTLRFIGAVDRHCANDIVDALGAIRFAPFDVQLSGVGIFNRKGVVHTLWAGVAPHGSLAALHRKIDRACMAAGLAPERRAYLPHITLARFGRSGGPVAPFLAHHTALTGLPFGAEDFILFESRLGHEGATYHAIERYRADGVSRP